MAYDGEVCEPQPPRDAPGIVYTTTLAAPGLRLFTCDAYRASLSDRACAARWAKAHDARGEQAWSMAACRTCSVGAVHAGRGAVRYSKHYRAEVCVRCGRGGARIIGGRICVSCYNRQREMKVGKNARGNRPVELLQSPLHPVELIVDVDGTAARLRDRETSGLTETVVQFLRTHTGEIAFGFAGSNILSREAVKAEVAAAEPESPAAQEELEIPAHTVIGETAPAPASRRDVCRYRARLFASTSLFPAAYGKKEPARERLAGWRRHEAAR